MFDYFSKYNYEVRERGEVITFVGNYKASKGQAAALVFYVFFGVLLAICYSFTSLTPVVLEAPRVAICSV